MDRKNLIKIAAALCAAIALLLLAVSWLSFAFEYAQRGYIVDSAGSRIGEEQANFVCNGYISLILLCLPVFAGTLACVLVRGGRLTDTVVAAVTLFACLALFALAAGLAGHVPTYAYIDEDEVSDSFMLVATVFQSELIPVMAYSLVLAGVSGVRLCGALRSEEGRPALRGEEAAQ